MAISIQIGSTNDAANKINKEVNLGPSIPATVKQPCSVENPVFILNSSLVSTSNNYLYCGSFGRYYYITDISEAPGQCSYVQCVVDPLKTYAAQILSLNVNVSRTETDHSNIIDSNLVTTANDEVVYLNLSGALTRGGAADRRFVLLTAN